MNEQMEFPNTFDEFAKGYGFKDTKEIYTNGSDLIPVFRVKQWLEHDNKLRTIETDTAYECGKHANKRTLKQDSKKEKRTQYMKYIAVGGVALEVNKEIEKGAKVILMVPFLQTNCGASLTAGYNVLFEKDES